MDHANAVLQGQEQPTVEDIIKWVEEEAFRMGGLGYRTGYANPEEIFASFSMSSSVGDFEEMDRLEHCATTAMMETHTEIVTMERRMQIMKANRPLLARAEARIDSELLAAGKSRQDIDRYPKTEKRLREKVQDLYTLRNPPPDPPKGVGAVLILGPKLDRRVSVMLPMKAALAEVCEVLEGVCASEDYLSQGWHKPDERGKMRIWKYNLVIKGEKLPIMPHSTRLLHDADYDHMIQQITKKKKGQYFQYAFLTPVSVIRAPRKISLTFIQDVPPETKPVSAATSVENDNDWVEWNPTDKNGVPFFEPSVDFSKVQIDEATGEIKEADLERIVREFEEGGFA